MGREEQIEEREVLDSIFPDEITGWACFIPALPYSALTCPCVRYLRDVLPRLHSTRGTRSG